MFCLRRLNKEYEKLKKNPVCNCSASPTDDIMIWQAIIMGPVDTPYQGGAFKLDITFSKNYPIEPPIVRFKTKIFHPNIDSTGGICIDILKDQWSPIQNVRTILLSICSLLNDPNPNDPLVPHIATLYTESRKKFNEEAQTWTTIYATNMV